MRATGATRVINTACILFVVSFLLSSCQIQVENEFVIAERTRDDVIEALNKKDKDILKSFFSQEAIRDAEDYEKGEEYLFSIFSGECELCEQTSRNSQGHMGRPGRNVYFPSCFPNGDYYFFVAKDFSYGLFGVPFKNELYVTNKKLISLISEKANELGLSEIKS